MKQRETLIRKIIPVEPFDMAGLEHWLSDMAAQGLHLVKLNHDTARFRRGEPVPGVRFGLEITGVADIDRERNAAYQEAGWTYVTTLRNLYYVYRTERADAPPLHTDPVTQSETLTPLIRRTRRSRLFLALWLLFCFRPILVKLITQPWMLGQYAVLETGLFLTPLVLVPYWVILSLSPKAHILKHFKQMRRQLADGVPLMEGRRDRAPIVVLNWCATALCLILPVLVAVGSARSVHRLSGPEEWTFPHVTLEQAFHGEADITLDTPQMMTFAPMDTPASPSSLWTSTAPGQTGRRNGCFPPCGRRRLTSRSGSEKTRSSSPTPPSSPSASPSRQRTAPAWTAWNTRSCNTTTIPPTTSIWAAGAVRSFACSAGASQTRRNVWRCS